MKFSKIKVFKNSNIEVFISWSLKKLKAYQFQTWGLQKLKTWQFKTSGFQKIKSWKTKLFKNCSLQNWSLQKLMSSKTEVFKNWSLQTKKNNFAIKSNDEIRLDSTFMAVGIKLKIKQGQLYWSCNWAELGDRVKLHSWLIRLKYE